MNEHIDGLKNSNSQRLTTLAPSSTALVFEINLGVTEFITTDSFSLHNNSGSNDLCSTVIETDTQKGSLSVVIQMVSNGAK